MLKTEDAKKDLNNIVAKEKETLMSDDERKAQDEQIAKDKEAETQVEAQKAKDDAIIAKKEEELTAEEAARIKTLADEKAKADIKAEEEKYAKLPADEKIKRIKEKSEKRIGEISSELKQLKDSDSKEKQILKDELGILRVQNEELSKQLPSSNEADLDSLLLKQETDRINKYLDEDKGKELSQRREMSDEDLNQWLIDDYAAANRWLAKQNYRRERELDKDKTVELRKVTADKFIKEQNLSIQRVVSEHPEINVKARADALKAEGKSPAEVKSIIMAENEKYRVLMEITEEDKEGKYQRMANGPEESAKEMVRRIAAKGSVGTGDNEKVDALTKQVEDLQTEIARMKANDEGLVSTVNRPTISKENLSTQEKLLVETMKSNGAPEASIKSAVQKLRKQKGIA